MAKISFQSQVNWIAACALMPTTTNAEKKYVIAIIRILSLHSLLFLLFFFAALCVCAFVCVIVRFFLFLVISLITHAKWFIKISLRTRYMLVCGQILDTHWKTLCTEGLERLHLLWFSVCTIERKAKRMRIYCYCCCRRHRLVDEPVQQVNYGQFTITQNGICGIALRFDARRTLRLFSFFFGCCLLPIHQPVHMNVSFCVSVYNS